MTDIPDGWVFYTADFSRRAHDRRRKGTAMLTRDRAGKDAWHALSEDEREVTPLYTTGTGDTIDEAIADACCNVRAALATPTPAGDAR